MNLPIDPSKTEAFRAEAERLEAAMRREQDAWSRYEEWRQTVNPQAPESGVGIREATVIHTPRGYRTKFPFPTPRGGQLEAVDRVLDTFHTGHNVLFNAGTGFGKSPVMLTIAAACDSAWILVGGRDLVEQYKRDYQELNHIGFLKSRQSFRCTTVEGKDCGEAKEVCGKIQNAIKQCAQNGKVKGPVPPEIRAANDPKAAAKAWLHEHGCMYGKNRDYALSKNLTVMTTAMALTMFFHMSHHPAMVKRKLLVVDESSELEDELLRFFELRLNTRTIAKALDTASSLVPQGGNPARLAHPTNIDEAKQFCTNVLALISEYEERVGADNISEEKEKQFTSLRRQVSQVFQGLSYNIPYNLEVEDLPPKFSDNHRPFMVVLAPMEARGFFDKALGDMADYAVFCSATTGPAYLFQETHGMQRPVEYVEAGTPFPAANRPIYSVPIAPLNRNLIDRNLPEVAKACVKIAKNRTTDANGRYNHCAQKGVIHTFTNKVTNAIVEAFVQAGLQSRIVVLRGGGPQRMETLEQFKRDKAPKILISPSAMIGLSLEDDLGRWQVIAKMPYANLGVPSVKHRQDLIDGWYSWQTTKDLIQTFGRIVRSPEDWGITYVVDASFEKHWSWNKNQFPDYVQQAVIKVEQPKAPPPASPTPIG